MLHFSCITLPLFIGDENRIKQAKIFVGRNPNKRQTKYSRWNLSADFGCCRSTGPVDRQRSEFWPLGKRSIGRSTEVPNRDWPLSVGRPDRSTGTNRELCSICRSTGCTQCTLVHVGRPPRSTDRAVLLCQRSTVRLTGLGQKNRIGKLLKSLFFRWIFFRWIDTK